MTMTMTTDDKPSITDLRRDLELYGVHALRRAAPVLLEVVAAAAAWSLARCEHTGMTCHRGAGVVSCPTWIALQALNAALAKVRP